ncbi:MAG: hypothetical protein LBR68_05895, partial [Lachnoclostridium sp.]|nr:hypothetical protein [Lachnoclostridium sp.]
LIPYHSFSDLEQRNEFYNLLLQKAELQGENPINSKSTKKTVYTLLCYGISFSIYALILLWGLKQKEEIFGYAYTSFYFIIPITSFLASLTITISGSFLKWIYPFLFGVLGIVISIIVFPKISWAPDVWVSCTMPAFIGLAIGMFTCTKRKKLSNTNQ